LTPSTVRVLVSAQPLDCAADAWIGAVHAGCHQRGKRRTCPVDVVHAPTAEPRAIGLLLADQPVDAPKRRTMPGETFAGEHLENVGGHVGAWRIDHLAEVAERQLATELARVVGVEGAPSAAGALHAHC